MITAACGAAARFAGGGGALRAALVALAPLPLRGYASGTPAKGTANGGRHSALYLTDAEGTTMQNHTPLILGLLNYFERHLPFVGYYSPFGGSAAGGALAAANHPIDRHLRLVQSVFGGDPKCVARGGRGIGEGPHACCDRGRRRAFSDATAPHRATPPPLRPPVLTPPILPP